VGLVHFFWTAVMASIPWSYLYSELLPGVLLKRYKRFLADIQLDSGEVITAHCPNTGPMTGVSQPGSRVMVSLSDNAKRKLAYTWELIQVPHVSGEGQVWVGINTALPNRVMRSVLEQRLLSELGSYQTIKSEVRYGQDGKSRIDFLLLGTPDERPIYVEIKNTTWTRDLRAIFPDCVTTRGQKHLRELINLLPEARSVMVYFINRGDCEKFSPGDEADFLYGQLLREAIAAGVEILPCRFQIQPEGIRYVGLAQPVLAPLTLSTP
jgi:sugar fermentation stimulation protein A